MKAIVGLGNPGAQYAGTRHNIGFAVVDELARRAAVRFESAPAEALMARWRRPEDGAKNDVLLVKPLTFMNLSGAVLREFRNKPWYGPQTALVCYDDIDLPLCQLRLRFKGSAGGHRGMLSCIEALGSTEIPRLRVGVGPVPPAEDAAEFVLSRFAPEERRVLEDGLERGADAVRMSLESGFEAAMNRFNQRAKA